MNHQYLFDIMQDIQNCQAFKYNLFSLPPWVDTTLDTFALVLCSINVEAQLIRTCYTQY